MSGGDVLRALAGLHASDLAELRLEVPALLADASGGRAAYVCYEDPFRAGEWWEAWASVGSRECRRSIAPSPLAAQILVADGDEPGERLRREAKRRFGFEPRRVAVRSLWDAPGEGEDRPAAALAVLDPDEREGGPGEAVVSLLGSLLRQAIEAHHGAQALRRLRRGIVPESELVGRHPATLRLSDAVPELARTGAPVLLVGGAGAGKRHAARAQATPPSAR